MIKKSKKKSSYRPRPDVYTSKDLKRMSELRSLASVDENKCVETAILPLTNVDYLDIWKASVRYLLKTQQPYISSEKWALCKQTALDFLELREDAVNKFHNIQEELRNVDFRTIHLLCDNILLKLQALKRFEAVYNRQPAPSGDLPPPTEPTYITGEVRPWNSRVVQAYADSNINENVSSVLIWPEDPRVLTRLTAKSNINSDSKYHNSNLNNSTHSFVEALNKSPWNNRRRRLLPSYSELYDAAARSLHGPVSYRT